MVFGRPFLLEVDMTKGWRVIDCTAMTGRLTYKRGQLVVKHHDTETRIPLADTAVLLLGMQTTVSTALLQQLAVFDVEVLICQWNEIPIAALQPWNKPNTRSAARQTAQQEMSIPARKNSMETDNTSENSRTIARTGHTRTGRWTAPSKPSGTGAFRRPEQY